MTIEERIADLQERLSAELLRKASLDADAAELGKRKALAEALTAELILEQTRKAFALPTINAPGSLES